jgi:hypothetical protein
MDFFPFGGYFSPYRAKNNPQKKERNIEDPWKAVMASTNETTLFHGLGMKA